MKRIILSGLMLMSFFFGAGNLIFAPVVGLQSGSDFAAAISGFNLTAVVIPLLTLVAVTLTGDSALSFYGRVGKTYGYVLTVIVILSIGPLFGIPRVANVSYELGIAPLFADANGVKPAIVSATGIVYLTFFFGLSFTLCFYGEKLVDTIGKYLSPALIFFIVLLVLVFAMSGYTPHVGEVNEAYKTTGAFAKGALDGYGTLDAVAAVAFAGIIVGALKQSADEPRASVIKNVTLAGVIAVGCLAVIYLALAHLGNVTADSGKTSGADILTYASTVAFGGVGTSIFAVIVFLACITTAIGLLKTISNYLYNLVGILSENQWLVVFTLSSAVLSAEGLDKILVTSVPMIYLTYPITISLMFVTLFNKWVANKAYVYFFTALFVTPIAIADGYKVFTGMGGEAVDLLSSVRDFLPLGNTDFAWLFPTVLALVIGLVAPSKPVNNLSLSDLAVKRAKVSVAKS